MKLPYMIASHGPTSIIEDIQWFPFMTTLENSAYNIETKIAMLPFLLKVFQCLICVYGPLIMFLGK